MLRGEHRRIRASGLPSPGEGSRAGHCVSQGEAAYIDARHCSKNPYKPHPAFFNPDTYAGTSETTYQTIFTCAEEVASLHNIVQHIMGRAGKSPSDAVVWASVLDELVLPGYIRPYMDQYTGLPTQEMQKTYLAHLLGLLPGYTIDANWLAERGIPVDEAGLISTIRKSPKCPPELCESIMNMIAARNNTDGAVRGAMATSRAWQAGAGVPVTILRPEDYLRKNGISVPDATNRLALCALAVSRANKIEYGVFKQISEILTGCVMYDGELYTGGLYGLSVPWAKLAGLLAIINALDALDGRLFKECKSIQMLLLANLPITLINMTLLVMNKLTWDAATITILLSCFRNFILTGNPGMEFLITGSSISPDMLHRCPRRTIYLLYGDMYNCRLRQPTNHVADQHVLTPPDKDRNTFIYELTRQDTDVVANRSNVFKETVLSGIFLETLDNIFGQHVNDELSQLIDGGSIDGQLLITTVLNSSAYQIRKIYQDVLRYVPNCQILCAHISWLYYQTCLLKCQSSPHADAVISKVTKYVELANQIQDSIVNGDYSALVDCDEECADFASAFASTHKEEGIAGVFVHYLVLVDSGSCTQLTKRMFDTIGSTHSALGFVTDNIRYIYERVMMLCERDNSYTFGICQCIADLHALGAIPLIEPCADEYACDGIELFRVFRIQRPAIFKVFTYLCHNEHELITKFHPVIYNTQSRDCACAADKCLCNNKHGICDCYNGCTCESVSLEPLIRCIIDNMWEFVGAVYLYHKQNSPDLFQRIGLEITDGHPMTPAYFIEHHDTIEKSVKRFHAKYTHVDAQAGVICDQHMEIPSVNESLRMFVDLYGVFKSRQDTLDAIRKERRSRTHAIQTSRTQAVAQHQCAPHTQAVAPHQCASRTQAVAQQSHTPYQQHTPQQHTPQRRAPRTQHPHSQPADGNTGGPRMTPVLCDAYAKLYADVMNLLKIHRKLPREWHVRATTHINLGFYEQNCTEFTNCGIDMLPDKVVIELRKCAQNRGSAIDTAREFRRIEEEHDTRYHVPAEFKRGIHGWCERRNASAGDDPSGGKGGHTRR